MMLIVVLGIIAKILFVLGNRDYWNPKVKDFYWNKVGIIVLTLFLKQAAVKAFPCVYISFVVPLTKFQYSITD
jgi:hypothetical protein